MIRSVLATRYVTPLREGGSLPAIVEADDDGHVRAEVPRRRAGPARADRRAGRRRDRPRAGPAGAGDRASSSSTRRSAATSPTPRSSDLLKASAGLNLALDYLPGSLTFDPLVAPTPSSRSRLGASSGSTPSSPTSTARARNTNMLIWHRRLWLIDHGAALYFHHAWDDYRRSAPRAPFPLIKRSRAAAVAPRELREADEALRARLTPATLEDIVALIPDGWLGDEPHFAMRRSIAPPMWSIC